MSNYSDCPATEHSYRAVKTSSKGTKDDRFGKGSWDNTNFYLFCDKCGSIIPNELKK